MAEGGVIIGAGERMDELAGMSTKSVEDGINEIKQIIKEQVDTLKLSLERRFGNDAQRTACSILLKGEEYRSSANGPDDPVDKAIVEKIKACKAKTPTFLIIIAPEHDVDSLRRKQDIQLRTLQADEYMKKYENYETTPYYVISTVENSSQMKDIVGQFIAQNYVSEIPIVVFIGHGAETGELVFKEENISLDEVLDDLYECHAKNRPNGMPLWRLRVVFSQCYAHKVDDVADEGTAKIKRTRKGVEYIYLTSSQEKYSVTNNDYTVARLQLSSLVRLVESDVYLDLEDKDKDLTQPKFLVVRIDPQTASTDSNVFKNFPTDMFGYTDANVVSKEILIDTIRQFTGKTYKQVVLVYGEGSVDGSKLSLHFSSKEKVPAKEQVPDKEKGPAKEKVPAKETVPAEEIFKECIALKEQLRMVFCCSVDGNHVWFSNAIPPDVTFAAHRELNQYAMAIIGPGPLNTVKQPQTKEEKQANAVKDSYVGTQSLAEQMENLGRD